MKEYKLFRFESYELFRQERKIELRYSLDGSLHFTETIVLPPEMDIVADHGSPALDRALFALHLMGGISYYKTCIPKDIDIDSGKLTADQAQFWTTVYENGLGEFFYKNNIDFPGHIKFPSHVEFPPTLEKQLDHEGKKRVLVPLGGGKDSVVTAEIMRTSDFDVTLFRMGTHPFIAEMAELMKMPMLTVERKLSGALFDLNAEGALNGHVPITGYLSFLTVVLSLLYGYDAVVMSNERSANEGNVEFHGKQINHQWSKSLEFERLFQSYVQTYVTHDVTLFSALRPLSELSIASLFSQLPQYFEHVTSCNANWKILNKTAGEKRPASHSHSENPSTNSQTEKSTTAGDGRWCKRCPKCAFSFALFSAFLSRETLEKMFGTNLFEKEGLIPLYQELLGVEGFKPFECVGTADETKAALVLAHERGEMEDTVLMQYFLKEIAPGIKDSQALIQEQLNQTDDHAIPIAYSVSLQ